MGIRRRKTRWSVEEPRSRSQDALSAAGLLGGILLAGGIASLCFLYVWQENRIRTLTATYEEARVNLEEAQEINRILSVRIDEAFSLERVARIAREQLGMSEPTIIHYVSKPTGPSD
jgi:cell division protein FtsL